MQNLHFVCEPDIDESNTVIQSAIEQAKMKFNIPTTTRLVREAEKT